jgi:hypothetical protein
LGDLVDGIEELAGVENEGNQRSDRQFPIHHIRSAALQGNAGSEAAEGGDDGDVSGGLQGLRNFWCVARLWGIVLGSNGVKDANDQHKGTERSD